MEVNILELVTIHHYSLKIGTLKLEDGSQHSEDGHDSSLFNEHCSMFMPMRATGRAPVSNLILTLLQTFLDVRSWLGLSTGCWNIRQVKSACSPCEI